MRTTEPDRWQALVDQVKALSPEILEQFRSQQYFQFLGQRVTLEDKDRYCTAEGLNTQLDQFTDRRGLVYYIDQQTRGMQKAAFEKTRQEHYK